MKLVEKKQRGSNRSYLLAISRKEFRLLAASLNAVIKVEGADVLAEAVPVSQHTIVDLQRQVNEALEAELTNAS